MVYTGMTTMINEIQFRIKNMRTAEETLSHEEKGLLPC
jgi:hypothetical protein